MMERTPEPELMDDAAQAKAYAAADFSRENQEFVNLFREYFPDWTTGHMIDLGCGPADIPIRFARTYPGARITAVDASGPMIALAEEAVFLSTGDFYATSVVRRYGLASRGGLVRAGCAAYTTADEVERLLAGVARLARDG